MAQQNTCDSIFAFEDRRLEKVDARTCIPAGSRLADALVVWDGYTDARIPATPLLLRFEDFDLLVGCGENGELAFGEGPVDTSRFDLHTTGNNIVLPAALDDPDACCPAWMPVTSLAHLAGTSVADTSLRERTTLEIAFESDTLTITAATRDVRYCSEPGSRR